MFKSIVEQAAEAIPVVKHLPVARNLGNIAAGAYEWYGEQFTGTHAERVEAAARDRRESIHRIPPGAVITQQPRAMPGGNRHRRAKRTRHQKKKRQRKSRKHKRTKRRNYGRRGTGRQ